MLTRVITGLVLAGLLFGVVAAQPGSAPGADDLTTKQLNMLAAEAQFFSALAKSQKDELDKLKATPCNEPKDK
jgi:hypothetical protein